jgi:hypothetical protein
MPFSWIEVHQHFKGMYCIHLQGWRVSPAGAGGKLFAGFLLALLFDRKDRDDTFHENASEFVVNYIALQSRRSYSL